LAGAAQAIVAHADGDGGPGQIGGDGTLIGKEAQSLQLARGVVKNADSLDPGRMLGVAQFAQIKKGFLKRGATARLPDIFNDAVVAMLFAVFLAGDETQKHNLARACQSHRGIAQGGESSLQRFLRFRAAKP
jgi:hypothetical protein